MKTGGGFTLLELIVVVALIGIFLVISVPTMRNTLIDDPLQSSARKVIGLITGVRQKAVQEQKSRLLIIDLDQNRLWHISEKDEKQFGETSPEKGVLELADGVILRQVWSKTAEESVRGIRKVWVSKQGYVDRTVMHLEDGGGESLSLVLEPFLPGVEIRDGYYEPE